MPHVRLAGTVFTIGLVALASLWLLLDRSCDGCTGSTVLTDRPSSPSTRDFGGFDADDPVFEKALRHEDAAGDTPTGADNVGTVTLSAITTGPDTGDVLDEIDRGRADEVEELLVEPPPSTSPQSSIPTSTPASSTVAISDQADANVEGATTTEADDGSPILTDPDSGEGSPDDDDATDGPDDGTGTAPSEASSATGTGAGSYPATVVGTEIFVDPVNGDDNRPGSSEPDAFRSLQRALDVVKPGQTVMLMSGEYDETRAAGTLHYYLGRSGTADAWIHITAAAGHRPTIVASSGTALFVNAAYVEVSNLTIRGTGFDRDQSWGMGISVPNTHHVRIVDNRISGMPAGGVSVVGSSNYQILNNTIFENAFWSDVAGSGISVFEPEDRGFGAEVGKYHNLIVGNRVYRNENKVPSKWQDHRIITDGNGIIIDSSNNTGYQGWTLVANNLAVDNGSRGILVWESSRVDVMHNTTYHNARTTNMGGRVEIAVGRSTNVHLANNVAWARPGIRAAAFDEDEPTITSDHNVYITDNGASEDRSTDTVTTPGSADNLLRRPSRVIGEADFRPTMGGSLVGMGNGDRPGPLSFDLTGTVRGSQAEPGAFETDAARGN